MGSMARSYITHHQRKFERPSTLQKYRDTYLGHVKDLNSMIGQLASNQHVMLETSDLFPESV